MYGYHTVKSSVFIEDRGHSPLPYSSTHTIEIGLASITALMSFSFSLSFINELCIRLRTAAAREATAAEYAPRMGAVTGPAGRAEGTEPEKPAGKPVRADSRFRPAVWKRAGGAPYKKSGGQISPTGLFDFIPVFEHLPISFYFIVP